MAVPPRRGAREHRLLRLSDTRPPSKPKSDRQGDEPLLRAVVQIALDPGGRFGVSGQRHGRARSHLRELRAPCAARRSFSRTSAAVARTESTRAGSRQGGIVEEHGHLFTTRRDGRDSAAGVAWQFDGSTRGVDVLPIAEPIRELHVGSPSALARRSPIDAGVIGLATPRTRLGGLGRRRRGPEIPATMPSGRETTMPSRPSRSSKPARIASDHSPSHTAPAMVTTAAASRVSEIDVL